MNYKINIMRTKILMIMFLCPILVLAQPPISEKKMEQIESQKIAFLTKELELTPKEAQQFWPIYNRYAKAKKENREVKYKNIKGIDLQSMSEEDANASLEMHQKTKAIEIEIESQYFNHFSKIIGYKRTIALLLAEEKFKKELLKRIREGRGKEQKKR